MQFLYAHSTLTKQFCHIQGMQNESGFHKKNRLVESEVALGFVLDSVERIMI